MAFNNASGIGNTEGFRRAWAAKGFTNVEHVVYESKLPFERAELLCVLATRTGVIVMGSFLPDTTIILHEWFLLGLPVHSVIPAWAANPQLVQAPGLEVTEGIISIDIVTNGGREPFARDDAAYRRAMSQLTTSDIVAAIAWGIAFTLAIAIDRANSPTPSPSAMRSASSPILRARLSHRLPTVRRNWRVASRSTIRVASSV